MRTVNLIKIDSGETMLTDNPYSIQFSQQEKLTPVFNSDEFLVNSRINVENIPITRVTKDGCEFYIAVKNEVWEMLYAIENPVTAESQKKKIEQLEKDIETQTINVEKHLRAVKKLQSASFLTRLKWLFTGVRNNG